MKSMISIIAIWLLAGCTHLASVSTTSIPATRGKKVKAESHRFIFLLLNFNNSYVDQVVADLAGQCPGGRIEGILTKDESITYFPILAHGRRVSAEGFCTPVQRVKKRG
jgi:hypothetical protein